MKVIRHHDPFAQFDAGAVLHELGPCQSCNVPHFAEMNGAVFHRTQKAISMTRANGDEIRPAPGIVVSRQSNRTPTVTLVVA